MATDMINATTRTSSPTWVSKEEKTGPEVPGTAEKAAALLDYHDPTLGETREETTPAGAVPPPGAQRTTAQDQTTLVGASGQDIALTALQNGSSLQETLDAMIKAGVRSNDATIAIGEALDRMGISNEKLTALAKNAQADIAALGGPDKVFDYFNDPSSRFQHTNLDVLQAALQARYDLDTVAQESGTEGEFGRPALGFNSALSAVADVLGTDTADTLPVGLAFPTTFGGPDAAPTENFVGHDELRRKLLSRTYSETAVAQHVSAGREYGQAGGQLDLPAAEGINVQPDFLKSADLSAPFTAPPSPVTNVNDVNAIITSAQAIFGGISGRITAELAADAGNGHPSSTPEKIVEDALRDKGVKATREQIAARLSDAIASPAYQLWLSQKDPAAHDEAIATLMMFDQAASVQVNADYQLQAGLGTSLRGPDNPLWRRMMAQAPTPAAAIGTEAPEDKGADGLATAQTALGSFRYLASSGAKGVAIQNIVKDLSVAEKERYGSAISTAIQEAAANPTLFLDPAGVAHTAIEMPEIASLTTEARSAAIDTLTLMSANKWFTALGTGLSTASVVLAANSLGVRAARLSGVTDPVDKAALGVNLAADALSLTESSISLFTKLPPAWTESLRQVASTVGRQAGTWWTALAGVNGGVTGGPAAKYLGFVLKNGGEIANLGYAATGLTTIRTFAKGEQQPRDYYNAVRSVVDASSFALWAANKKGAVSNIRMNQIRFITTGVTGLLAFGAIFLA